MKIGIKLEKCECDYYIIIKQDNNFKFKIIQRVEDKYEMSLRFFESSFPKYEKLISNLVRRMKMKLELL